jgi:ribosomal subunit interface protein
VDIIFKGRRTDVQERFRRHASAKLGKIERLDSRASRIDVEISTERNPRQSDRRERVELTIRSRGPVIRAEAAADDRYAALDRALPNWGTAAAARDRRKGQAFRFPAERGAAPRPVSAADGQPVTRPGSDPGRGQLGTGRVLPAPTVAGRSPRRTRPARMTSSPSRWKETARWWYGRSSTRPRR